MYVVPRHTVNLSDEAYRLLRNEQHEGESFSEVVMRILGKRSLAMLKGMLTDEEAASSKEYVREINERGRQEIDDTYRRLRRHRS